jgi:hypothetical protein
MKPQSKGIGGHQSANMRTDVWLTPPEILSRLGEFDLDPCAPIKRPWDTAKNHYTIEDNGLILPWKGRVYLNPPYGNQLELWMRKMAEHREGISLIFARTDTQAFHKWIFPVADSLLFIDGRVTFCNEAGMKAKFNGGAPSVLIAYGEQNVDCLEDSKIRGRHVYLNSQPMIVVGVNKSWKAIVTVALTRMDGEAPLQRIYEIVERIAPEKTTTNKHYREQIRKILQLNFKKVKKGVYTLNLEESN